VSDAVRHTLDAVVRSEHGRMIALLARTTGGDLLLAEDALQQAAMAALEQWPSRGTPDQPVGWLVRTARNKAIDHIRRSSTWARKAEVLAAEEARVSPPPDLPDAEIPDERLRLICTCCHPALARDAQVGLTLRTVCGLTTDEIARAFMLDPRALAQRLVRAQRKIKVAGIPYAVPGPEVLPQRLSGILRVVYLVFTEGWASTTGEDLVRGELCDEAIRLGALVAALVPDEGEVHGLMALMLLQDARRDARTDAKGRPLRLPEQDRGRWDRRKIALGMAALGAAVRRGPPGPYTLQAAIASVHARAPDSEQTDWPEIVALYDLLERAAPSPSVALNRAAAIGEARGAAAGLAAMDVLQDDPHLGRGHLLPAARGAMLRRLGRQRDAAAAYRVAAGRAGNAPERAWLTQQLVDIEGS
jgi:RNA polymerase sigma-70 factor, ECF subfamily